MPKRRNMLLIVSVLLAAVVFLFAGSAQAAPGAAGLDNGGTGDPSGKVNTARVIAKPSLNLRSAMDLSPDKVTRTIPYDKIVSIIKKETGGWYNVQYKEGNTIYRGYVKGGYLEDNSQIMLATSETNLRTGETSAGTSNILAVIPKGAEVELIERTTDKWYYVNYKQKIGFVLAENFKTKEIPPKVFDLKNVKFDDIFVYYDEKDHYMPRVKNLPKGVTVTYSTRRAHCDIGSYTVVAKFKPENARDKLVNAKDMSATLTIGIRKGALYTRNKLKVRILDNNIRGKGKVRVAGPASPSAEKLKIPEKVRIGGVWFTVTEIGMHAFKDNKKLKAISIADTVTAIRTEAFQGCTKLETVKIGAGMKEIKKRAFDQNKKLKKITINSEKLKFVGKNVLRGISKDAVIKVPEKKLKKYTKLFEKKGQKKTVKIKAIKKK